MAAAIRTIVANRGRPLPSLGKAYRELPSTRYALEQSRNHDLTVIGSSGVEIWYGEALVQSK
jgi:hypothetical protein